VHQHGHAESLQQQRQQGQQVRLMPRAAIAGQDDGLHLARRYAQPKQPLVERALKA
jgi:hypothetical protein